VNLREDSDYDGETYKVILLSDLAWDWIEQNESKFLLRKGDETRSVEINDEPF